jgi:hypothetical protein
MEEEKPAVVIDSKAKKSKAAEVIEDIVYDSPNNDSDIEEIYEPKKGAKAAEPVKKKSTFTRLTDIITKSPILEPLRCKIDLIFYF